MTPPSEETPPEETEAWETLDEALQAQDTVLTKSILDGLEAEDQARAVSLLSQENREALLVTLPSKDFAQLLQELPEAQAVELLETLPSEQTAAAVECLPAETSSRLLRELEDQDSAQILHEIQDGESLSELKARLEYPEGCAGSLMRGSPVSFPQETTVQELLNDLYNHADDYSDRDIQYLYVVDEEKRLVGVLQLRQLFWAPRSKTIGELMIPDPLSVSDQMDFHDLAEIFTKRAFLGLPVVDDAGRLVGVVPRDTVQRETSDEQTEQYLQSQGIVDGEELRSMPLFDRCRKRLAWLAPNIVLNLAAASVIAANEATLQEVISLAVFLPIVSDMSGCSGNQAVAVSIRELTLGILKPKDFVRVLSKEGLVGIINGSLLGILLGAVAAIWKGNLVLGAVVASALALNTVLSVLLGGLVPLFLKSRKVDPALASGPILTTCTDMCGFFLVLSLASAVLDKLT
ncbi:magnesium transporter [Roseibacillus persicicus]|uniref:magnesium transporter n=1 Tax=Roseibacillus persicicus TaxID=454148 RepID=UPI00280C8069|nr:magnesium transporter [Roseibacillus persicicus]MDQ8191204.1 magnesium transporter [Roseibacillus persicicus]